MNENKMIMKNNNEMKKYNNENNEIM